MMIEEKNQMLKKFQMLTREYVSKIEEFFEPELAKCINCTEDIKFAHFTDKASYSKI